MVVLSPEVWGPHYWFFLHTVALTYPHRPNDITKKKFYEFIQNLPLFMPIEETASEFTKLLDKYPVQPYLDSRDAFVRWVHFIHNKVNERLEKQWQGIWSLPTPGDGSSSIGAALYSQYARINWDRGLAKHIKIKYNR